MAIYDYENELHRNLAPVRLMWDSLVPPHSRRGIIVADLINRPNASLTCEKSHVVYSVPWLRQSFDVCVFILSTSRFECFRAKEGNSVEIHRVSQGGDAG